MMDYSKDFILSITQQRYVIQEQTVQIISCTSLVDITCDSSLIAWLRCIALNYVDLLKNRMNL
jgi:hypothetical protein